MVYKLKSLNFIEFSNKLTILSENLKNINTKEDFERFQNNMNVFFEENISPKSKLFEEILSDLSLTLMESFRAKEDEKFWIQKKKYIDNFNKLIHYFSITESIKGNKININGISDKNDFILEKLNELFNYEYFFSIGFILRINRIEFRKDENNEIVQDLKRRGYIIPEKEYETSDTVKISVKGASYIERKLKSRNGKKIKKNKSTELDKKIDLIIEQLTKLGYGQQIIFDEIEEIRELQNVLPKKSWGQLLKGKLFDLALEEIISKETASEVFEFLTNTTMKLLK